MQRSGQESCTSNLMLVGLSLGGGWRSGYGVDTRQMHAYDYAARPRVTPLAMDLIYRQTLEFREEALVSNIQHMACGKGEDRCAGEEFLNGYIQKSNSGIISHAHANIQQRTNPCNYTQRSDRPPTTSHSHLRPSPSQLSSPHSSFSSPSPP